MQSAGKQVQSEFIGRALTPVSTKPLNGTRFKSLAQSLQKGGKFKGSSSVETHTPVCAVRSSLWRPRSTECFSFRSGQLFPATPAEELGVYGGPAVAGAQEAYLVGVTKVFRGAKRKHKEREPVRFRR